MTKYIPQGTDGDKFIVKGVYSKKLNTNNKKRSNIQIKFALNLPINLF